MDPNVDVKNCTVKGIPCDCKDCPNTLCKQNECCICNDCDEFWKLGSCPSKMAIEENTIEPTGPCEIHGVKCTCKECPDKKCPKRGCKNCKFPITYLSENACIRRVEAEITNGSKRF